jgi:hypothetical protein
MACKLCLQEKPLRKSHIFPEFLYRPLYDPKKHRFHVLSTSPAVEPFTKRKGYYERLLCQECEQIIGRYEDYSSKVLKGGIEIEIRDLKDRLIVSMLDYTLFKLFLLSILWRSSISSLKEFSEIFLGPHEEKLRKMLFKQKPGMSHEYGIIAFYNPTNPEFWQDFLLAPDKSRINGHTFYRFVLGGIFWSIVVSSHSQRLSFKNFFLSEKGKIALLKDTRGSSDFVDKFVNNLNKQGKLPLNNF